jgi:hypothetical protein
MPGQGIRIWSNPEFVRHRRAELRPVRAVTVSVVVLVMCVLLGMACWSSQHQILASVRNGAEYFKTDAWTQRLAETEQNFAQKTWLLFYNA